MTGKSDSITIRDIAREAGVSVATVSRYLNKNAPISGETARRIQQVMQALNYQPRIAARQLATQRTQSIGFVLHTMQTGFFAPLLNGIETVATENDYNLLVTTSQAFTRKDSLPPLGPHNVDGLLVFTDCLSDQQLHQFWLERLPMVLVHRISSPVGMHIPSVTVENQIATRKIIDHLIEKHHRRRILFLRGPAGQEDSILREKGYLESLAFHGIAFDENLVRSGDFSSGHSYHAIKRAVLHEKIEFDAVFTGDDDAAIGVLTALDEVGLRIPGDVSVVGFDDLEFSAFLNPPLTTVRAPTEEIGRIATGLLLDQILGSPVEILTMISPEIIIRRSCGCENPEDEKL